ncbi:MAG: hypothetical protein SPL50_08865 [Alloprevotella sp.]|nr:hypothetical protein [Alloprevotella sp.]
MSAKIGEKPIYGKLQSTFFHCNTHFFLQKTHLTYNLTPSFAHKKALFPQTTAVKQKNHRREIKKPRLWFMNLKARKDDAEGLENV